MCAVFINKNNLQKGKKYRFCKLTFVQVISKHFIWRKPVNYNVQPVLVTSKIEMAEKRNMNATKYRKKVVEKINQSRFG